jgi:hypothetical protein
VGIIRASGTATIHLDVKLGFALGFGRTGDDAALC